jgi:signal transduction histidine kinase
MLNVKTFVTRGRSWDAFLLAERSFAKSLVIATIVTVVGFIAIHVLFISTEFYFSSLTMMIVILVGLSCGAFLSVAVAVIAGLASDYYYILPLGRVFDTPFAYQHFIIMLGLAILMAALGSSLRTAFRQMSIARIEAELSSKTMEKVLALVAHDIRDPLSGIQMVIESILPMVQLEKHRSLLGMMLRSARQADRTIQSLLDVASMRAGKIIALQFTECDLGAEVAQVIEEITQEGRNRLEFVAGEPIWGRWGMNGIRRAIENLVNNAIKYGEVNAPIRIAVERQGSQVMLSVHNEGDEIRQEHRVSLFQAFWRADTTEVGSIRGCGLGLSLVQGVASAHGGVVWLRSEYKEGTTFTLALPLRGEWGR